MKVAEILKLGGEMLKILNILGIKVSMYEYVPLYEEYEYRRSCGEKMTSIGASLSDKYCMCERKVYKVIKALGEDCQVCA